MTLFELQAKLGLDKGDFDKGVRDAEGSGKDLRDSLSDSFGKIKTAAKAFLGAAIFKEIVDEIRSVVSETAAMGDQIDKQSQVLGLSRKAYQEWDYILSQNGASIESMSASMRTLNKVFLDAKEGNKEANDAFAQLGISVHELDQMNPEEQFEALVKAFQKLPAGAQKSALAVKIFGRGGMQLLPLLNNSAESIDELKKKAEELGLIMGDDAVDASVEYTDAMDTLKRTLNAFKYSLGSKLLPSLTEGITKLTNYAGKLRNAYEKEGFAGVFKTIIQDLKDNLPTWADIKAKAVELWKGIQEGFTKIAKLVFGEDKDGNIAWPTADEIWAKVQGGLETMWNGIKGLATDILKLVFGESDDGGIDWGNAEQLWYKVGEGLRTLWDGIKKLAKNVLVFMFGEDPDGGIKFPTAEETYRAIGNALNVWWTGVKKLCKGVLNLLLGALGLPDIDETVRQIKEWWEDVKKKIALKIFVKVGGYQGFGFDPSKGETWSEGVRKTNEKFGINIPTLTDEDMERYADDSWASGESYVPYDNFRALLHRGEKVLTASQARRDRNGRSGFSMAELAGGIIGAVREGMDGAQVNSYMDSTRVTNKTNSVTGNRLMARRFAPA